MRNRFVYNRVNIKKPVKSIILLLLMGILAVLVAFLVNINSRSGIAGKNCSFASACKVLAYITGYNEKNVTEKIDYNGIITSYWFTDYYNYLCEIGMFPKDILSENKVDRALMESDLNYVYQYLGLNLTIDEKKDRAISNESFINIINSNIDKFPQGNKLISINVGIVATSGEADSTDSVFNEPYTVCTNKGSFHYKGLNLTGFKDKTIEVLVVDDEILMIKDIIDDKTTFKNVWISDFYDNTLFVNMYGVNREFKIGGTSENVTGMIADIEIKDGKLIGITIKKNITDTNVRILLYNSKSDSVIHDDVVITSDNIFYTQSKDYIEEHQPGEQITISQEDVSEGEMNVHSKDNGQIQILSINKSQGNPCYEGNINIYSNDNGVVIVNELPIESYLKRVVPSEMPSSFGVEALKVQTVCARSYAYAHLESYAYPEYMAHMDDTVNFQVYNNTVEKPEANEAITATCGKMLYYADQIVTAYYYSTSCGAGTDVSLWGSNPASYPYYVSREITLTEQGIDLSDENSFRSFIKNENKNDYDYGCKYYRWNNNIKSIEINKNLNSMGYSEIGNVKSIRINNRVSGGAVNNITICGSKADVNLSSEGEIRKVFNLPSAFFIVDSSGQGSEKTFTFTGGGYGHGIGMSQNAVKKMADNGMDYVSILNFFYAGTTVF